MSSRISSLTWRRLRLVTRDDTRRCERDVTAMRTLLLQEPMCNAGRLLLGCIQLARHIGTKACKLCPGISLEYQYSVVYVATVWSVFASTHLQCELVRPLIVFTARFQRSRGQSLIDLLTPERAYFGIIVIMCALRIYNTACTIVSRHALRLHVNIDKTFTGPIRGKRHNDNELNRCRNDDVTTKDNGILRQCVHFCVLSALVCIVQLRGFPRPTHHCGTYSTKPCTPVSWA